MKKLKVFISHSHKDKWITSKIAADLEASGIECFFDESDMSLGDTLKDRVKQEIKDSTHFLVVMTSAATSSTWMPYELALADFFELIVIPVIYNVDKNEIFEMLLSKPRYDLNNFDKVISKLKKEQAKQNNPEGDNSEPEPEPEKPKNAQKFINTPVVGGLVQLPVRPPNEAIRATENIGWVPGMNPYLGKSGKVLEIDEDDSAKIDVDGGKYWYAFEWLESV